MPDPCRSALELIAAGHPEPERLAKEALAEAGRRWLEARERLLQSIPLAAVQRIIEGEKPPGA